MSFEKRQADKAELNRIRCWEQALEGKAREIMKDWTASTVQPLTKAHTLLDRGTIKVAIAAEMTEFCRSGRFPFPLKYAESGEYVFREFRYGPGHHDLLARLRPVVIERLLAGSLSATCIEPRQGISSAEPTPIAPKRWRGLKPDFELSTVSIGEELAGVDVIVKLVASAAPPPAIRRNEPGRPPETKERIKEKMRTWLDNGHTHDELSSRKQEDLVHEFGGSRRTCQTARDEILKSQ